MKDIIVTAITVFLAVVLIVLLNAETVKTDKLQKMHSEMEVKTNAYSLQKKELEDELEALREVKVEKETGKTSMMFVFTETDDTLFNEIVPKLNDMGVPATICITKGNLPNISQDEGLSLYEVNYLLNIGWQTAMYWDGTEEIDMWYLDTTRLMSEVGVEIPRVLCIDSASYDASLNTIFENLGFEHVIIMLNSSDTSIDTEAENINLINARPWYTTASADQLSSLKTDNSQFAFLVGVKGEELAYESSQFDAMLKRAAGQHDKLVITTPDGALEQIIENQVEYERSLEEYNNNIKRIENEIAEINKKIDSIYDEYFAE